MIETEYEEGRSAVQFPQHEVPGAGPPLSAVIGVP